MCNVSVPTTLDVCGHVKHLPCAEARTVHDGKVTAFCDVVVSKFLPCGHEMKVACGQDPSKVFCQAQCERNLSCGSHHCTKRCGDDCSKSLCQMKVFYVLLLEAIRVSLSIAKRVSKNKYTCCTCNTSLNAEYCFVFK